MEDEGARGFVHVTSPVVVFQKYHAFCQLYYSSIMIENSPA